MKGSGSFAFEVREMEAGRGVQPEGVDVGMLLGADEDAEEELLEGSDGGTDEELEIVLLLEVAVPGRH